MGTRRVNTADITALIRSNSAGTTLMTHDVFRPEVVRIDDLIPPHEAFLFERGNLGVIGITQLSRRDHYALLLLETGQAALNLNGAETTISTGDVVFLRPTDQLAFQADSELAGKAILIRFRRDTAAFLLDRYTEDLDHRYFWSHDFNPARSHLKGAQLERAVNTCLTLETTLRNLLRLEHFLLTMMTFVLDDVSRIDPAAPDWLVRACRAAQSPEVFSKGSAGFIDAAGRTQEHVSRVTKQYLGTTPTKYVNRIRIQHAAMLLRQENLPLEEIAEATGLDNLSYFHRLFRSQYGCTPATYRKRHKCNGLDGQSAT